MNKVQNSSDNSLSPLLPDNLQKYISSLEPAEKSVKAEIFQIMTDKVWDEDEIAGNYEKLSFRERLEFQFDELIRDLNMCRKDEYIKILEHVSDAASMLWLTIENHESTKAKDKGIYYWYIGKKLMEIMTKFQPDLKIIVDGYTWLPKEKYTSDIKIAYLWALWQILWIANIGNKEGWSRKDTPAALSYLSSKSHQMIQLLKKMFFQDLEHLN